jgi:hypothetical protein
MVRYNESNMYMYAALITATFATPCVAKVALYEIVGAGGKCCRLYVNDSSKEIGLFCFV